jgi:hypothetical protein
MECLRMSEYIVVDGSAVVSETKPHKMKRPDRRLLCLEIFKENIAGGQKAGNNLDFLSKPAD